jgi:hypothetical protein
MKSSRFWHITSCKQLKVNRCFGGTCRLQFQDWKVSEASRQQAELVACQNCKLYKNGRDLGSQRWRWRRHFPPKRLLTFNGLHGDIFQKTTLQITMLGICVLYMEYTVSSLVSFIIEQEDCSSTLKSEKWLIIRLQLAGTWRRIFLYTSSMVYMILYCSSYFPPQPTLLF